MTQPGNKEESGLGPHRSSRRQARKRARGKGFQTKSRQDFVNDPNRSSAHQGESMERNYLAMETTTSWQDHPGPSKNSPDYERPRRGDQTGYHAGAMMQTLPWQDHPGPYDNSPDGSWPDYGKPQGQTLAADVQSPSWQAHHGPFKNIPDRNGFQQGERIEQDGAVVEKTPCWQDHTGLSGTVLKESQENEAGQNAGAMMQRSAGQYYAWPNDDSPGDHSPHQGYQREYNSSAALQRRSLKTHSGPFEDNSAQRSSSHEKSWERAAQVCLPYPESIPRVRDQETHPTPVAPKKFQFFNPEWAPYPPAQDMAPATTHQIPRPSTRQKTAQEVIQAHLGMKKGRSRRQNSSNDIKDISQPVVEECGRGRPKVSIPRRQCYSESKPGFSFRNGIAPLEPVASTYENGHHDAAQEDKGIPTVCLPGKDSYEDQCPHSSGEFKANGVRRPGEL